MACRTVYSLHIMGENSRLQIDVDPRARAVVLSGDIDIQTAPEVENAVTGLGVGGDVTLEMSAVRFMDSSGLRTIISCRQALDDAGQRLLLAEPSDAVRRVLEITGLSDKLDITDP